MHDLKNEITTGSFICWSTRSTIYFWDEIWNFYLAMFFFHFWSWRFVSEANKWISKIIKLYFSFWQEESFENEARFCAIRGSWWNHGTAEEEKKEGLFLKSLSLYCRVRPPTSSSSGRVVHMDPEDCDTFTVAHPLQEMSELKTFNWWKEYPVVCW